MQPLHISLLMFTRLHACFPLNVLIFSKHCLVSCGAGTFTGVFDTFCIAVSLFVVDLQVHNQGYVDLIQDCSDLQVKIKSMCTILCGKGGVGINTYLTWEMSHDQMFNFEHERYNPS